MSGNSTENGANGSSKGRARVLGALRRSLGREELPAAVRVALTARLSSPKSNLIPARGDGSPADQVALFTKMAEAVQASVVRVPDDADVLPELLRGCRSRAKAAGCHYRW